MKSFMAALRSLVLPFGRTAGQRIILDGENGTIQIYDDGGALVAELAPVVTNGGGGGLWVRGFQVPDNIAAVLAQGLLSFRPVETGLHDADGEVEWLFADTSAAAALQLKSGTADASMTPGWVRIHSSDTTRARPLTEFTDNSGTGPHDVSVGGALTAGNIRRGVATAPAPGTGGGTTSIDVTFSTPMTGVPSVVITPSTTVDPAPSPTGVDIRGYVTNRTTSGFRITCYRSTNASTSWSWIAASD